MSGQTEKSEAEKLKEYVRSLNEFVVKTVMLFDAKLKAIEEVLEDTVKLDKDCYAEMVNVNLDSTVNYLDEQIEKQKNKE